MSDAVSQIETVVYDLSEKESEINNEIDCIFDRFHKVLEDRREKLHREVQNYCHSKKRELQEKVSELKNYSTNVKTAVEFANRVMSYTTASEFLILRNILLKRVLELKNHSVSIPAKEDSSLKFYRGATDESFTKLVNVIGNVVTRDIPKSPETLNSSFQSESYKNSKRSSFSDFQIDFQNDINGFNSSHNSPSLNDYQGSKYNTISDIRTSKVEYHSQKRTSPNGILETKSASKEDVFESLTANIPNNHLTPKHNKHTDNRLPAENERGVIQAETNKETFVSRENGTPDSEFETARMELRDAAKTIKESKFMPIVNGEVEASTPSQDKPSFFSRNLSSRKLIFKLYTILFFVLLT